MRSGFWGGVGPLAGVGFRGLRARPQAVRGAPGEGRGSLGGWVVRGFGYVTARTVYGLLGLCGSLDAGHVLRYRPQVIFHFYDMVKGGRAAQARDESTDHLL